MADKEIAIKVTSEADVESLSDLTELLDSATEKSVELGEALTGALEEAETEVEELTEQLAGIEMGEVDGDFEAVQEQLELASEKAEMLQEALDNIDGSGLSDASSGAEDLANGLDTANQSAGDLSDSLGLIEGAMLMDVANQIGAIGDNAENMSQQMNTASITVGQLATNVGMAEPQMVALINHISNMTFPQEEAMAYVNLLNQMGVSADKLGDSATNMDRINDATGMGYQNVMQLTQGLQALGISADNLPASFNAIAYAEANVGGGAETLQQVLRRQAGALNEYGMNVDATVVALSALQRETGLTGMKLGSEFSKRLKECNGDVSALEQSLGLQAGALSNASSETGKYAGKLQELADEEMEHKTFVDQLNAVWEDMSLALSPVLSPMMSLVGLIGQFGQTALAINSIITLAQTFGILGGAETALIPIQMAEGSAGWFSIGWIALAIALGIALGLALIYLYENCDWFREAVDNLAQTLQWLAETIWNGIMQAISQLQTAFQNFTNQIGLNTNDWVQAIIGFILFLPQLPLKVGEALVNTIAKALGFGNNFTSTMRNGAMNAVNGFISWIQQIAQRLQEEFNHMLEMASQFALDIADRLSFGGASMVLGWISGSGEHSPGYMYDALMGELSAMVIDSLDLLNQLTGNMFENGTEMANALITVLEESGIIDVIMVIISAMFNFQETVRGVADYIMSIGGLLPQSVSITGNQIIDGILRVVAFIMTLPAQIGMVFTNVLASVLGFGNNFSQRMLSAGSNAVSNFISSISRMPSEFANEIANIINQALNFAGQIGQILWNAGVNAISGFLGGLGRHSPGTMQREFRAEIREMGEAVPEESRSLISNISRLGSNIVGAWDNPNLAVANGGAVSGAIAGGDTVINIYGDVDNDKRVQEIVDAIRRELSWNNVTAGRTV